MTYQPIPTNTAAGKKYVTVREDTKVFDEILTYLKLIEKQLSIITEEKLTKDDLEES